MGEGRYYDWARTMSFGADVTMVVAHRGRGKTFGLRRMLLSRALKPDGPRFAEVVRYKNELGPVMAGYFDKLAMVCPEFEDWEFSVESHEGRARKKGEGRPWRTVCFFVALTEAQSAKKRTYARVGGIIYDEALIDRTTTFGRYLPREPEILANLVDTLTRQIPGEAGLRPHAYLLANAVDLVNPYFAAWGIDKVPPFGFSWHAGHVVLLHYEKPGEAAREREQETLAGRMLRGTAEARSAYGNAFEVQGDGTIAERPSQARFWLGLAYRGRVFGVWTDRETGLVYVDFAVPQGAVIFALTRDDGTVDRVAARRSTRSLRLLADCYYDGALRFVNPAAREGLLDALAMFGVR